MFNPRSFALSLALSTLMLGAVAHADPHPLPFSYPYSTLPRGMSEVEQYTDMTVVKANVDDSGAPRHTLASTLVSEIEYGITDRLELGLYFQFGNDPAYATGGDSVVALRFDGVKQRLRYRFADAGVWPVNVAIYGEVAELANEIELEAKIILDRRIGRWHLMANLWGEREFYYSGRREWVANPTGGVAFEIAPAFHLGVEYWMHGEFGAKPAVGEVAEKGFDENFHHYLGPAFLLQGSRLWVSVAPYLRLDAWDRDGQVGDHFGRFWFRTIIGLEL